MLKVKKLFRKGRRKKYNNYVSNFCPSNAVSLVFLNFWQTKAIQIEAARRVIIRKTLKLANVRIRIKPNFPLWKKSEGARMGKGKGKQKGFISKVSSYKKLFIISCFFFNRIFLCLTLAKTKVTNLLYIS